MMVDHTLQKARNTFFAPRRTLFHASTRTSFSNFFKFSHSWIFCVVPNNCRQGMNIASQYSTSQVLNVHAFSCLYTWIYHIYRQAISNVQKESFGLSGTGFSPSPSASAAVPVSADVVVSGGEGEAPAALHPLFRDIIIRYCFRALQQVEHDYLPTNPESLKIGAKMVISEQEWMRDFIEAASMEAVRLLDLLCLMDPSLVSSVFPAIQKVYERTAYRQSGLVFSVVLQFFLNHSHHVMFDVEPV